VCVKIVLANVKLDLDDVRQNGATNARMLRHTREHLSIQDLGLRRSGKIWRLAVPYRGFEPLGGVFAYVRSLSLHRAYGGGR
jgi:hypothetical protein